MGCGLYSLMEERSAPKTDLRDRESMAGLQLPRELALGLKRGRQSGQVVGVSGGRPAAKKRPDSGRKRRTEIKARNSRCTASLERLG